MKVGEGNWDLGVTDERLTAGVAKAEATLKQAGATGTAAMAQTGTAVQQTTSRFGGLLSSVNATNVAGTALGVGLGALGASTISAGITTATRAILGTVDAASAMNESVSKANVVFGDSAAEIHTWAESAAEDMGLSTRAATEAAGTFGNLFTAMGIGRPKAADMSEGIVQLASDLASFNNVPIDDALVALRAGLVGEIEPMRRFGVNLTQATIEAKALELGLWNGAGALDANSKAQASYALILEQTSNAQGDYARTSDGLANSSRTMEARIDDLQVAIGQQLLPVFLEVLTFGGDLLDLFGGIGDAISQLNQPIDDFQAGLAGVGDQMRDSGIELDPKGWAFAIHDWAAQGIADFRTFAYGTEQATADVVVSAQNMGGVVQESVVGSTTAVRKAAPEMGVAAKLMGDELKDAMARAAGAAERIAAATPGKLADAIRAGRQDWRDAVDQLGEDLKNASERSSRIAELMGALHSRKLAQGLRSEDPLVRAQAAELQRLIEEQLQAENAYEWGGALARAWARGVASEWGYAHAQAVYLGTAMSGPLEGESPPKEGPLHEIDKGGANVIRAWAGGAASQADTVAATAAGIADVARRNLAAGAGGVSRSADRYGVGGTTIRLELNWSSLTIPTPAEGQRVARQLADPLMRELRRQRVVG